MADPAVAVREAWRVLRPGGTFVASTPSRFNDPEFGEVDVEPWDVVAFHLAERRDVADYLHGRGVPDHEARAAELPVPLGITKRGARVWATRRE